MPYITAEMTKTDPMPVNAMRNPIIAGPTSLVELIAMEESDSAFKRFSLPTRRGMNDIRTGWFMANPKPISRE